MGNYHPHGDASIYDTLVRLAQDFNMRYPLVDGQGNFGSVDGDPPAAMRYTEARPEPLAEAMMADIDKETVDFVPNYDETTEEPTVLPTPFPNLLVNGSAGIAVGMATNIPPHNMREVIDGVHRGDRARAASRRDARLNARCCRPSPAPTSRPAASSSAAQGIFQRLHDRPRRRSPCARKATIEESKKGDRSSIVVTEIPYQVNKARLIENIAELRAREDDRRHLRPARRVRPRRHADRHRAEARRGARGRPEQPLQAHAAADDASASSCWRSSAAGRGCCTLLEIIEHFIEFRREVVRRRTEFELRKAEARAHILEGLKIALDHLDAVIALIRGSKSPAEARDGLMTQFRLSQIQAQAILDMQLQRLTGLERQKILDELAELMKTIERLRAILVERASC